MYSEKYLFYTLADYVLRIGLGRWYIYIPQFTRKFLKLNQKIPQLSRNFKVAQLTKIINLLIILYIISIISNIPINNIQLN